MCCHAAILSSLIAVAAVRWASHSARKAVSARQAITTPSWTTVGMTAGRSDPSVKASTITVAMQECLRHDQQRLDSLHEDAGDQEGARGPGVLQQPPVESTHAPRVRRALIGRHDRSLSGSAG